jgi:hypothetical protein
MSSDDQAVELRARFFSVRETRPADHIYLLLDDASPVAPNHPLQIQQLTAREIKRERIRVDRRPASPHPEWQPHLLQFYRSGENGYADEELIDLSLSTAVERCASINGAYVAAWIATELSPPALSAHLLHSGEIFDSHRGRRHDVPLYQPHRMALLADDSESLSFLRSYLEPIHSWTFVDAAAALRTITFTAPHATQLTLSKHLPLAQCRAQARVPAAKRVMLGIRKAGLVVPGHPERVIDALLLQAERHGLSHTEDLVFFALNGLSLSPAWHAHPRAKQLIALSRDEGAPLSGLFGELSDDELEAIGRYEPPGE